MGTSTKNSPTLTHIKSHVRSKLAQACHELMGSSEPAFSLAEDPFETPPKPELGELAFGCFPLAKILKKSPAEVAKILATKIQFSAGAYIENIQSTGPYLNIKLKRESFIAEALQQILTLGETFGAQEHGKSKTVVIDYSSPNIAKHLAFHHLRSAVIGKALCNLFGTAGYKVIGINHLGDWGTQFGKLITAYLKWGPQDGNLGDDPISLLNDLYVRFQKEVKDQPDLLDEAREWFKKLEDGDAEAKKLWQRFRDVSLQTFDYLYRRLDVRFTETSGESSFVKNIPDLLKQLEQKKLSRISEGALIVDLAEYNMPPCLLKKADEASLYATRDLCAAIYRAEHYHFDHLLYVVDTGQSLHFKQFFKVLELMKMPWANRLEHISFGIIKFAGAKTRTREGNIILLEEVLDEAVRLVDEKIAEKNPDLKNRAQVAEAVGIGAVIFADLSNRRVRDVNFDWKEILSFDGRTGPYVQYSYARARSILRKAAPEELKTLDHADIKTLRLDEEWQLVFELAQFPQSILKAVNEREPSFVADAVLNICEHFHRYHALGKQDEAHRVLTSDANVRKARLYLTRATAQVLANGLKLLGMQAPEEM